MGGFELPVSVAVGSRNLLRVSFLTVEFSLDRHSKPYGLSCSTVVCLTSAAPVDPGVASTLSRALPVIHASMVPWSMGCMREGVVFRRRSAVGTPLVGFVPVRRGFPCEAAVWLAGLP